MLKFTADELRILRNFRNMQQKGVAVVMGISTQRYSALERNEGRTEKKTMEILKALRYTPKSARELLDGIPPPAK